VIVKGRVIELSVGVAGGGTLQSEVMMDVIGV